MDVPHVKDMTNWEPPLVLVPLPVRSLPQAVEVDFSEQPEWLVNFSNGKSKEQLQQILATNQLAHTKAQLDRMELECYVQPTYDEVNSENPLLMRNQMYNERKLRTAISSSYNDPLDVSNSPQNDTSSRISISALLSDASKASIATNDNKQSIPIDHSPYGSVHATFDGPSFTKRREIARANMLPLKRIRIDPNDFIYQKPLGSATSASLAACGSHIDMYDDSNIYNDQYIYLSQDQELLTRKNKKPRLYQVEYGSAPIRPEDLSPKATTKWNALAKNDIYKQYRTQLSNRSYLVSLAKKTAIACQKEVKKKVLQSVRQGKDAGNRGKKLSREVMMYWRKHDKGKRGAARRAQKTASQLRKRDDEIREAKRQQKKLNFLLTQTELYAHFIGKKTDVEGDQSGPSVESGQSIDAPVIEDEELAKEAAAATEQAIRATRARMEAFDQETNARKKKLGIKVKEANSYVPQPAMPSLEGKPAINESIREGEHKFGQPSIFAGKLKNYQLRGLNWLINLYDQGINGILADDMGLGKTIQTIAFLGHLAEEKDIWGPFIVVAPVSTLHNWIQEIARFTPALKALPYWGTAADRKVIRRFWTPKHMYTRNASMQVVVTSYQLIVQDEKYFKRVKWQYMVLDEAHALKSTASVRWKTLLGFHCRNRLLLTGTPIQNNMAELWALLHFIMPSFFDSHEEFNDWFSKDIENHAEGSGHINEQQLSRLHTILKPFMLRRVKNDIADEMVEKFELEQHCHLTERQKRLYRGIKANISISDLLSQNTKTDNSAHLMNLVMQFRKVCNHPELFERRGVTSPFQFIETVDQLNNNPIHYSLPKFLYRESLDLSSGPRDVAGRLLSPSLLKLFNIYTPHYIEESLRGSNQQEMTDNDHQTLNSAFSFARLSGMTEKETSNALQGDLLHQNAQYRAQNEIRTRKLCFHNFPAQFDDSPLLIRPVFSLRRDTESPLWNQSAFDAEAKDIVRKIRGYFPAAVATPVVPFCPDRSYMYQMHDILYNGRYQQILYGKNFKCSVENASDVSYSERDTLLHESGLVTPIFEAFTATKITVPDFASVINDSGKLKELDRLLFKLKAEGHCVLIYSQMTKMLNLLEEYMNYRKYSYHRLDGASKLSERRDMVSDFQNNGVFAFLLSTRAGGLGINLTAADTVIFYDSDWNPTMDDQAMDRAHRLGQTRPVTVYRLVTVDSIEERILARAKEKHNIQSIVIAGGKFEAGAFNSTEVVSLLLNDNEVEQSIMKSVQENNKSKRKRRK